MIVEIKDLHKSFKDVKAVNGISLKVKEGELFAFLGLNGAGKSTTINIMSGILKKDSGKVVVCGNDIDNDQRKINENIGIVFQNSVLDKKLTVYENLKYRASLYGINGKEFKQRLEELAQMLNFNDLLKRTVGKLSGGQRRRVDIARSLFHHPKLLILDEPTTGLDPQTRITVWNVIDKLRREENLAVFLTTHYMEEASNADYVVILDYGVKVCEGTPHELKNKYANDILKIYDNIDELEKYFLEEGMKVIKHRDYIEVVFKGTENIPDYINDNSKLFTDFEVIKGNMDNVFLNVTGKELVGE